MTQTLPTTYAEGDLVVRVGEEKGPVGVVREATPGGPLRVSFAGMRAVLVAPDRLAAAMALTAAQARAHQRADDYRRLADFIEANPDLLDKVRFTPLARGDVLVPVSGADAREIMLDFVAAARRSALAVAEHNTATDAGVNVQIGGTKLHLYANRSWLGDQPAPPAPTYAPLLGMTDSLDGDR